MASLSIRAVTFSGCLGDLIIALPEVAMLKSDLSH